MSDLDSLGPSQRRISPGAIGILRWGRSRWKPPSSLMHGPASTILAT